MQVVPTVGEARRQLGYARRGQRRKMEVARGAVGVRVRVCMLQP